MKCRKCGHDASEHRVVTTEEFTHHPLMHCGHIEEVTRDFSSPAYQVTFSMTTRECCRCETGNKRMVPYAIPYERIMEEGDDSGAIR